MAVRVIVTMLVIMVMLMRVIVGRVVVRTLLSVFGSHRQQFDRPHRRPYRESVDYSTGTVPITPDSSKDAISEALSPSSVRIS